ncbi:helix-turn-helix transcriptional regulator [Paenibacillus planticolens]|uniref:Helix-turn-helix domain-containing protein n=1 Tax=Paenibacillus planticolens TaxID=2654976 RepID=A0ABX1ZXE6_9BACL|nr:helix-turn-helix domain-containing protein [Paenibacillus planticolens]NOV04538.1 helix-turn-helix domain-containing protein [Paenibacillus planticolens]
MKLSTNVDVRKEPFHLNHCKSSPKHTWEIHHAHPSMEFLYVYEGEGRIEVNKQVFLVEPGTLLLFQPFQLHRIYMKGPFVRTVLMFDPYKLDAALQTFSGIRSWFNILWKQPLQCQALAKQQHLEALFERLHQKLTRIPVHKQHEEFVLCLLAIIQGLEPYEKAFYSGFEDKLKTRYSHTAVQMIDWIELHFKEKFDLNQMSEDLHLSTYYLSHTFRQSMGSSITEFIVARRLKEACYLLETTNKTASFIAQEVGFLNASYFCRVFKTVLGMTPKTYRLQL